MKNGDIILKSLGELGEHLNNTGSVNPISTEKTHVSECANKNEIEVLRDILFKLMQSP